MSNPLTTHVLDTAAGTPARGLPIGLEKQIDGVFVKLGSGQTNDDGRLDAPLLRPDDWGVGCYRIRFDTGTYFDRSNTHGFYPYVEVVFEVRHPEEHHHVPLLLSPHGYSTYRGS